MTFQCESIRLFIKKPKKLHISAVKSLRKHLRVCGGCNSSIADDLGYPLGCTDETFGRQTLNLCGTLARGKSKDQALVDHVKECFACSDEVGRARQDLEDPPIRRIEMETSMGPAEAIREKKGDPWHIGYPWGDDDFYGTEAQVRARMKKNIKENDEEDKDGEEG